MVDPESVPPPSGIGRHHSSFPDMFPPAGPAVPPAPPVPPPPRPPVVPVPQPVRYEPQRVRTDPPPVRQAWTPRKIRLTVVALVVALGILVRISWFLHTSIDRSTDGTIAEPGPDDTYLVVPDAPSRTPDSPFWTIVAPGEMGFYEWRDDNAEVQSVLLSLTSQGIQNPTIAAYEVYNDPQSRLFFYGVALLNGTLVPEDKSATTFDQLRQGGATVGAPRDATAFPDGYGKAQCAAVTKGAVHQVVCVWRVSTAYAVFTFTGALPADPDAAGKTLGAIIQDIAQPY